MLVTFIEFIYIWVVFIYRVHIWLALSLPFHQPTALICFQFTAAGKLAAKYSRALCIVLTLTNRLIGTGSAIEQRSDFSANR